VKQFSNNAQLFKVCKNGTDQNGAPAMNGGDNTQLEGNHRSGIAMA